MKTRSRLRMDLKSAANFLEHALRKLKEAEEHAAGRHPVLNEELPKMVTLITAMQRYVLGVRDRL